MSAVRCGLDLEHEPHEHPGGSCDGHVMDLPELQPGDPVAKLFTVTGTPVAFSWASLTLSQARELRELLDNFVVHYNATYAVEQAEVIPACWPLHPGLAHELAALYALHVHLFQSGLSGPDGAAGWFERWLPRFQERMPHWLGVASARCNPNVGHREEWSPVVREKLLPASFVGMDRREFDDAVEDALYNYTRSAAHLDKP